MNAALPKVSVKSLCEFTARSGDLDLRFTPVPSASQGRDAHQAIQTKRGADYDAELALEGDIAGLRLRGRADGFNMRTCCLEEIKSHVGPVDRIKSNHRALHWAQLKVYGALLCQAKSLEELRLAVVYVNALTLKESREAITLSANELIEFARSLVEQYRAWHEHEERHRAERDQVLAQLAFPFATMRDGQRAMARAVYWAMTSNAPRNTRPLVVEAPTGIGKTLASLYGALRAAPVAGTDRVFYLTPKTSGKTLAWGAIRQLFQAAPAPRVIELVAKEKACEYPEAACHPESCPLAAGFYDRLPQARLAIAQTRLLPPEVIRATALEHQICPYYFTQALASHCDVVIADYNYYFDRSAMLYSLTREHEWKVTVLVDEAHCLLERARGMYGAALSLAQWKAFAKHAPKSLARKARVWLKLWATIEAPGGNKGFAQIETLPDYWLDAAESLFDALARYLNDHASELLPELRAAQFSLAQFLSLVGSESDTTSGFYGVHALKKEVVEVEWVCVSPAIYLKQRIEQLNTGGQGLVLFSATLGPTDGFGPLLGLSESLTVLSLESPFDPSHLKVHRPRNISTRKADRDASASQIAQIVRDALEIAPGNYLAFFNSFEHLRQVQAALGTVRGYSVLAQHSGMQEAEQTAFIEAFRTQKRVLGLAVLGGRFSEGIDLPGAALIGVFVAGLGYAAFDERNKLIAQHIDQSIGQGFDRHFLYPALQRVVQAAGRVIRTETDAGALWLLDDRFNEARVRKLLPAHWSKSTTAPQPA